MVPSGDCEVPMCHGNINPSSQICVAFMKAHNQIDLPELEEEIRRFETARLGFLRFPRELEARFQRETGPSRARMLLVQGLLSLLISW